MPYYYGNKLFDFPLLFLNDTVIQRVENDNNITGYFIVHFKSFIFYCLILTVIVWKLTLFTGMKVLLSLVSTVLASGTTFVKNIIILDVTKLEIIISK